MQHVETDAGGSARRGPDVFRGQPANHAFGIFERLEQSVRGGLQNRFDAVDRSAKPNLWSRAHAGSNRLLAPIHVVRSRGAARHLWPLPLARSPTAARQDTHRLS
jgi:hypothetical protein